MPIAIHNWPPTYYMLRERLPFYFLILYVMHRLGGYRHMANYISTATIAGVTAYTVYLIFERGDGTNIKELLGFWTYAAPIEWGTYIATSFLILAQKRDPTTAATITYHAAAAGGWLYEIPYFITIGGPLWVIRVNGHFLFFFSYQIIAVYILYLLLKQNGARNTWYTWLGVTIYLLYYPIFLYRPLLQIIMNPYWGNWLNRLFVMPMLLAYTATIPQEAPP